MQKVLLGLFGLYRTFETTSVNIREYLIDNNKDKFDFDIVVCTDLLNQNTNYALTHNYSENKYYSVKELEEKMNIAYNKNNELKKIIYLNNENPSAASLTIITNRVKKIMEYVNDENLYYDMYIFIRLDVQFNKPVDLNLFLNENDNLKRMYVITSGVIQFNRPDHNRDWDFGYISDKLGIEYYFDIKPMQQYNFELSDLIQLSNIVKFKSMYVQDCLDAGEIIYHSDKYPRWWIYKMWIIAFILYKNGYLFSLESENYDIFLNIIR